ncbi:MAG TPA: amidohydrolase family protein [Spirochaetota bacterium]|nr:amidohydrolase family protein [Spirochaetota bacterium]
MIIDAHTHIYADTVADSAIRTIIDNTGGRLTAYTRGTHESLLHSMDTAGVDISIVLPVATRPSHGHSILQWIQEKVPLSNRMIFFGSVHPYDPDYKKIIKECKASGLQGIKFHPAYQGFPADDETVYKVYDEILNNDLAMYFHSGFDMSLPECDYTSVERFSNVLNHFKNTKIILAHAGGDEEWEKVIPLLSGKGCYFDIAFVLENMKQSDYGREMYRLNEDYFVFGTDSPWRDQAAYVQLIQESSSLTQEQKEKMFYKNIQKIITI